MSPTEGRVSKLGEGGTGTKQAIFTPKDAKDTKRTIQAGNDTDFDLFKRNAFKKNVAGLCVRRHTTVMMCFEFATNVCWLVGSFVAS